MAAITPLHPGPVRFEGGLTEVGPGLHAWLQPNGLLGESNAGLVVGDHWWGNQEAPRAEILTTESAAVVFAADILFIGVTPIRWAGPLENWIAALERLLGLGAGLSSVRRSRSADSLTGWPPSGRWLAWARSMPTGMGPRNRRGRAS